MIYRYRYVCISTYTYLYLYDVEMGIFCCGFAGTKVVIVVSVVSSVVVLAVGLAIGHHIWKNRYIEKKRRGNILLIMI